MLTIESISNSNLHHINKTDTAFTVDSILKIKLSENKFSYEIESVSHYEKVYGYEKMDYSTFINNKEKTVFFAFVDEELAGQIIVTKHWSFYARIEDIRIQKKFRGQGIGSKLIKRAIEWAKAIICIGMVVETQSVNAKACLFYEKNGFVLGGADIFVYKASPLEKNEILLNWYLLF